MSKAIMLNPPSGGGNNIIRDSGSFVLEEDFTGQYYIVSHKLGKIPKLVIVDSTIPEIRVNGRITGMFGMTRMSGMTDAGSIGYPVQTYYLSSSFTAGVGSAISTAYANGFSSRVTASSFAIPTVDRVIPAGIKFNWEVLYWE